MQTFPPGPEWQQTGWPQQVQAPLVYPQLNGAALHVLPGITLQPLPMQPPAYGLAAEQPPLDYQRYLLNPYIDLKLKKYEGKHDEKRVWRVLGSKQNFLAIYHAIPSSCP